LIIDAIDLKVEGKTIGQMIESIQEELYECGKYAQKRGDSLIK